MLLVAGRLEAAGLDQRKLPSALLPGNALAASRAVTGPDPDWDLPQPPPDAGYRVARLWASTDVALPHGGTAVDATTSSSKRRANGPRRGPGACPKTPRLCR
jgi:hypothetical protein